MSSERDDEPTPAPGGGRGGSSLHDTGAHAGHDPLARALTQVARRLERADTTADTLEAIVRAAVETVPGVDEASVSLVVARRSLVSEAASGPLPRVVDALQTETGQGPCIDAAYHQETIRVPDMAREGRWPLFAARAADAGARGMLAVQLFVSGDDLGALNLYSYAPGVFDDRSEHVALMLASHASIAYAAVRRQAQLSDAVASRLVIGQAQGILMERYGLDDGAAFAVLARTSRTSNLKLREVAGRLVETRALPEATGSRDPGPSPRAADGRT